MTHAEFEKLVRGAARGLPKKFRSILNKEGIRLLAREKAPRAARRGRCLTFGMFIGVPYTERSVFDARHEPTRIELYQDSFEKAFDDPGEMKRQIAVTVMHEVGHYFGFSEKELRRLLE